MPYGEIPLQAGNIGPRCVTLAPYLGYTAASVILSSVTAVRQKVGVLVAFVALALAGCSAHSDPAARPSTAATASATPTPTPTVHTMSLDEAGKYYLGAVCPANKAQSANNAAFAAQDLAAIQSTAAAARDAYRAQAAAFTKSDVMWPSVVSAADLKLLSDADFAMIATYESMSGAATLDAANAVSNGYVDNGAGAAAQRIRLALNLPADTSIGC